MKEVFGFLNNFINSLKEIFKNITNKNFFWFILSLYVVLESSRSDVLDKLLVNLPQISGFVGTIVGFYAGQKSKSNKKNDENENENDENKNNS